MALTTIDLPEDVLKDLLAKWDEQRENTTDARFRRDFLKYFSETYPESDQATLVAVDGAVKELCDNRWDGVTAELRPEVKDFMRAYYSSHLMNTDADGALSSVEDVYLGNFYQADVTHPGELELAKNFVWGLWQHDHHPVQVRDIIVMPACIQKEGTLYLPDVNVAKRDGSVMFRAVRSLAGHISPCDPRHYIATDGVSDNGKKQTGLVCFVSGDVLPEKTIYLVVTRVNKDGNSCQCHPIQGDDDSRVRAVQQLKLLDIDIADYI